MPIWVGKGHSVDQRGGSAPAMRTARCPGDGIVLMFLLTFVAVREVS